MNDFPHFDTNIRKQESNMIDIQEIEYLPKPKLT